MQTQTLNEFQKARCLFSCLIVFGSRLQQVIWAFIVPTSLAKSILVSVFMCCSLVSLRHQLVLCALSPLCSSFMLPSISSLQISFSTCSAALRNQLFCIYFIAIGAFPDFIFTKSPSLSCHFIPPFCLGLALKLTPPSPPPFVMYISYSN